ncbi:hypothetical protein [Paraflavitalea speifideaquila]|uniref:sensor histidine kinase n=1 Tax=Paraflavitalea speifideaquila TaxID=3076558 RepID=UPI0028EA8796|nr:hypothetical protein [Paraflavitalea speifideiaquila]
MPLFAFRKKNASALLPTCTMMRALLATARLYLNENLVNLDKTTQLQSIYNAKQIIDDTIQLIRNISHSLMPPTLKNFGLESAVNDLFQKISGSGSMNASCRFHDYRERLHPDQELIIFRVIQELVNNILKHSNASFIHLTQNLGGGKLYIRLHHDGRGSLKTILRNSIKVMLVWD